MMLLLLQRHLMPEAGGICHGHRPTVTEAEHHPQVGRGSLFDDTPNLLCVSELHVNRQRIIQGAILSWPDTAFASQEALTDTPGIGLSPSQRRGGVEATRTNEPKAKSAILHSPIAVLARAVPNGHGHTADGLWSVSYILHNLHLNLSTHRSHFAEVSPHGWVQHSVDQLEFVRNLGWSRPAQAIIAKTRCHHYQPFYVPSHKLKYNLSV